MDRVRNITYCFSVATGVPKENLRKVSSHMQMGQNYNHITSWGRNEILPTCNASI